MPENEQQQLEKELKQPKKDNWYYRNDWGDWRNYNYGENSKYDPSGKY